MGRRNSSAVIACALAAALLASCQTGQQPLPKPSATRAPAGTSPGPTGKPSAQPPAPTKATTLKPLPRGAATLAGKVKIDAAYAVATAGAKVVNGVVIANRGRLIGNDGSTLIGNDGGTLIGNDGSTLIGNDGSTLIGNDGSTLVAAGGLNLVVPASELGEPGGAVLASDGAPLLGNDGSTLIGNDGSTLVAAGGLNYRLAQASGTPAGPLPAAGMWVSVVDTRDGATVPLGLDDAGQPVYAVYSDQGGNFSVQIPAALAPFVRVVARAPKVRDPRLVLSVLAKKDAKDVVVDDEQAAASYYLRRLLAVRLLGYLGFGPDPAADDAAKAAIVGGFPLLKAKIEALKASGMPAATFDEISLLIADAGLADVDLDKLQLFGLGWVDRFPEPAGPRIEGEPLIGALVGLAKRIAAGAQQAAGTQEFQAWADAQPWLIALNMRYPDGPRRRILRPADVLPFLAGEYLASVDKDRNYQAFDALDAVGTMARDIDRIGYAAGPVLAAMLEQSGQPEGDRPTLDARLTALATRLGQARAAAAAPAPAGPPLPTPPPGEAWVVDTVATGLGAPAGLALDGSGATPVLYVADIGAGLVRRVDLDAAGDPGKATVTDLTPRTGEPVALALDGKGALYVADMKDHVVRRLDLATKALTLVAGMPGQLGFEDGKPGAQTKFEGPQGLAFAPDGGLLVADRENARIRRIDLVDPAFPVRTVVGSGLPHRLEGPLLPAAGDPGAALDNPTGLAFSPTGELWFVQSGAGAVSRTEGPFGTAKRTRLVAGDGLPRYASPDGFYHEATLDNAVACAFDPQGRLIVVDHFGNRVRRVSAEGWITTLAGRERNTNGGGFVDGAGEQARFANPLGVVVAKDGTIYIGDSRNHAIRRLRRAP